jgi:diguanylate cyclase (GGDEF)-like protein
MKRQLRTADYVARVGGDEFVILLPEVKPEGMEAVTAKLLRSFHEIHVAAGDTTITSCASIGWITCLPLGDEAWTPDSILHAADLELDTAKAGGRDAASHRHLAVAPPP